MKNTPLVSIIIATFEMAAELDQCLRSIDPITREVNLEVLVIDGGSKDNTMEVLQQHAHLIDIWISEPDNGVYYALEKGIRKSQGEFLYFLGADDRLLKGFVETCSLLSKKNTIYYGNILLGESNRLYDGPFSLSKLARTNICQQAIIYPRSTFNRYTFSMKYPIQADWYLNMQLATDPNFMFQHTGTTIACFADTGLSSCSTDTVFDTDYLNLVKKCFPFSIYLQRAIIIKTASLLKHILPQAIVNKLNSLPIKP